MKKNDLVYIPLLGTEAYRIEDIKDDKIIVNGKVIQFFTNFVEVKKEPVEGNFNYRTGYITGEGKVLPDSEEEVVYNKTSTFVFPVNLRTHYYLEQLTGDTYQKPKSPLQVARELLSLKSPILCKTGMDYTDAVAGEKYVLIYRYNETLDMFYDIQDKPYPVVVPFDCDGNEIKELEW